MKKKTKQHKDSTCLPWNAINIPYEMNMNSKDNHHNMHLMQHPQHASHMETTFETALGAFQGEMQINKYLINKYLLSKLSI